MNTKSKYDFSSLNGKTAIITGGAGILGKHFSEGLASCGSHVVIVDLNKNEAEILASDLSRRYGQQCISIECDVSEPASVNFMVDEVEKKFGDIHVLHNNAASKSSNLEEILSIFVNQLELIVAIIPKIPTATKMETKENPFEFFRLEL